MRPTSRRFLATALLLAAASPCGAHEYWLFPSRYQAARGDTVVVRAGVGTGFRGETKPFAALRATRLEVLTTRAVDVRTFALNGGEDYARFVAPDDGGAVVTYESNFATIQLPAPEFDAYLRLEGLDGPLRARIRAGTVVPGRERYSRCCRTWIAGRDLARATMPAGLPLEVSPQSDPCAGGTVAFRVLLRGRPLPGALVRAWNRPLDPAGRAFDPATRDSLPAIFQARTNGDGVVRVPVGHAGEWMINAVHMEASTVPAEADWQSLWASFTFARREARRQP